jgi:hypothetical protein
MKKLFFALILCISFAYAKTLEEAKSDLKDQGYIYIFPNDINSDEFIGIKYGTPKEEVYKILSELKIPYEEFDDTPDYIYLSTLKFKYSFVCGFDDIGLMFRNNNLFGLEFQFNNVSATAFGYYFLSFFMDQNKMCIEKMEAKSKNNIEIHLLNENKKILLNFVNTSDLWIGRFIVYYFFYIKE